MLRQSSDTPIVIVGAGLAGLYTALKLAPLKVTVVSPNPLGTDASSAWAQGGIAAAVGEGDTPEQHAADTIKTGAGIVDEAMAHLIADEAPERIRDLLSYGVPFDKDLDGRLRLSREAAHSRRRIVRVKGDLAGKAVMASLVAAVRQTPSITVLEGYEVKDLGFAGDRVNGVYLTRQNLSSSRALDFLPAREVVITSGGIGGLYAVTTNPAGNRGDAIAMAARVGAVIADAEFVQFHPTALNVGADPAPLASEALRGEGAILVNGQGKRFMEELHELAELAPRDMVARAVQVEVLSGRGAYLDCRDALGPRIHEAFPTVTASCLAHGIDPAVDLIPVAPAAHYHMGGIWTDENGRSTVEGLWAAGEAASTGVHGANRLASNSLLEAMVFGGRIADDIKGTSPVRRFEQASTSPKFEWPGSSNEGLVQKLRQLMSKRLGVVREEHGLNKALSSLEELEAQAEGNLGLINMITASRFVAVGALCRLESRGGHYRTDYPRSRDEYAHRTMMTLSDIADRAWTHSHQPIHTDKPAYSAASL